MTLKTFEEDTPAGLTDQKSLRCRKVLVPIDFSPSSRRAFELALRICKQLVADLTLMYVTPPAGLTTCCDNKDEQACAGRCPTEKLRLFIARAAKQTGETPKWIMRAGVPSHEIVEAAKEKGTDLIIIATHGYTGWKHFCIGSTAERVVRAAPCPVLVVREKEHQFC